MAENRSSNTDKIRVYILTRLQLGLGACNIHNEICGVYGCNEVLYGQCARCIYNFKGRLLLIKNAPKSGRTKSAITPKNIHKGNDLIARYTKGDTCT